MTRSVWAARRLGDLCKFTGGGAFPKSEQGFSSGDYPFIKVSDLASPSNVRRIHAANNWVSVAQVSALKSKLMPAGSVVFAKIGEGLKAERLSTLTRVTAIDNNLMAAIPRDGEVDATYLYYLLSQVGLSDWAHGSALPYLRQSDLDEIPVVVPPLSEQRRIAGVLGALDDLIEVNRRLIRDLDDLGLLSLLAALPRGSAEVDGSDETDGWEYTTLADASSVLETGSRPKGGVAAIRRGVPSVGAESIDGLARFNFSKVKFVSEEFFAGMKRGHVASGDVLVYKDGGTPGSFTPKVGMFGEGFPFGRMSINEHVFRVRVNSPISNAYLYFWLRTERMMSEMHRAGTGAAIPGINKTAFGCLPIVIPPAETAQPLCASLENICTAALQIANEIRQLEETRDELLPLLMSGRVRVAEEVAA